MKLKIYSTEYSSFLENHKLLKWEIEKHRKDKNQIIIESTYKGMKFQIIQNESHKEHLVIISGSIHKYKNGGIHNYDLFTVSDLIKTVYSFCSEFQINWKQFKVQSPEIGINIPVNYVPDSDLYSRFVVINTNGGSKPPNSIYSGSKGFESGVKFSCSEQYSLKVYTKENDSLRIEIQIDKMRKLGKCKGLSGVDFSSLINYCIPENLDRIFWCLIKPTFEQIIIDETIEYSMNIDERDYKFYLNATKGVTWLEMKDKNLRRKYKSRLAALQQKHGSYSLKDDILKDLIKQENLCLIMDDEAKTILNKLMSLEYLKLVDTLFTPDHYYMKGDLV